MYRKILVPLDGSKLAESVLPHLESVARGCDAEEVILVSVTERIVGYRPIRSRPPGPLQADSRGLRPTLPMTSMPVVVGKKQAVAQRYLGKIAKRLQKTLENKNIKLRMEVLFGHPAEEIINFAQRDSDDLILMSSHGRSGSGRWAYGNIADKILRTSSVPVLMVRALGSESTK
ncbi:universal stress protein [Chloroflexota bacterium]